MTNFFKFNSILMLSHLLIADIVGSSSLNPYASPYFPKKGDHHLVMIRTIRNGQTLCVSPESLLKIEYASNQELESYTHQALALHFWTAVYNGYHKIAYKIAEILFADFLPKNLKPFPNLSNRTDAEIAPVLLIFYSLMTKIDCDDFSPTDLDCFSTHAARLSQ